MCVRLSRAFRFSSKICILIGCINRLCLKCEQLRFVELLRYHFRKIDIRKIDIFRTRPLQNEGLVV